MANKAWVSSLRMLAARRLTESQLRERLIKKEFPAEDIADAIERARNEGYIDDKLYAELYVEARPKALGNRRLIGDLVKRGIPHDEARAALQNSGTDEDQRLAQALDKLRRTRPNLSLGSAARSLERLGFPTQTIYHFLQAQGAELFADPPEKAEHQAECFGCESAN